MNRKHVYLTGFMGAGKSKIGPLLSRALSLLFYDTDHIIEETSGKKIIDIFEQDGEERFRDLESAIIGELAAMETPAVIALGGGALIRRENRKIILESGWSVYISSSPEAVFERVRHSGKRPLLKIEPGPDRDRRLLEHIRHLLADRDVFYRKADIIVERDGLSLERIVETLTQQVNALKEAAS